MHITKKGKATIYIYHIQSTVPRYIEHWTTNVGWEFS